MHHLFTCTIYTHTSDMYTYTYIDHENTNNMIWYEEWIWKFKSFSIWYNFKYIQNTTLSNNNMVTGYKHKSTQVEKCCGCYMYMYVWGCTELCTIVHVCTVDDLATTCTCKYYVLMLWFQYFTARSICIWLEYCIH